MLFNSKKKQMVNSLAIVLLLYALFSFVMGFLNLHTFDIISIISSISLFIAIKFFDVDNRIISILSIILGIFLCIIAKNVLFFIISAILVIYSSIILVRLLN